MTIDEAIIHCEEVAIRQLKNENNAKCVRCGKEHVQLAKWLKELKAYKSREDLVPVVRCRDCKYWDNGNLSFECPWDYGRHGSSDEDDFCSYGERKESAYEI